MILGLNIQTWLGLTVLGALVSTAGTLLGIVLKDFFFARSLESWKHQKTLEQLYQRYRDPLFLSASELATRLSEVLDNYPTVYLRSSVLQTSPDRLHLNSLDDPYFQKHKLFSSVYRLAAFLGWLELYRQEITYLRSASNPHSKALEYAVNFIRRDLADGQINKAHDWKEWRDCLIFRDELRAIGEAMIETRGSTRAVVGYGRFLEAVESETDNSIKKWFPVVSNFLIDLEVERKDFRQIRIKSLFIRLVDLMKLLEATSVENWLIRKRNSHFAELYTPQKAA
ncbi:hypothetical protein ATN89_11225 [Comamonas thiooxydans]|uniref:hypothetical protein n=1 Tax=Comamonas thiooxydans TaxID=363952 RepID=UPI0007C520D7|nr:hypothetical protein [Comamonas thiooxydans]OAD84029.1 hypothetical protein ATN89_11225 [Comamonas thiooxydans]